ncbi:MAG: signal peptide peptidase SppA [Spongiibacteraceae bacterium]
MDEKKPGFIRRSYRWLMRFITALRLLTVNLFFLVMLGFLIFVFSSSELPSVPKKGALLLDIKGSLVDQKTYTDPLTVLLGDSSTLQREVLVEDVIDAINYAREDQRITSLVLSLDNMVYGGLSKMLEIKPALDAFRNSGKKIIAIGNTYNQDQYWLASQADEVYVDPMGEVALEGYGLYRSYFKQALDKLKINFHVFRVGEFKSAMEPYMRDDMSAEAKKASRVWLGSLWDEYTAHVAERRNLSPQAINEYINTSDQVLARFHGDGAAAAVANGLVDGIKTRDEANSYLLTVAGAVTAEGDYQSIGFEKYLWRQRLELSSVANPDKVGLIVAAGTIVDGEQLPGAIGGDTLAALIREARRDENIKALVLRIDSGGGSAFASEIIKRELDLLQHAGKPLVISMGSMAASGGYWISANADEIWALPTTLTGSIGIFGAFPTVDKSLAALGVNTDGVGTTDLAGAWRIDRPLQAITANSIQSKINHGYAQFLELVATGRGMSTQEVEVIAEGRVWSGADAQRLGLVDHLGTLQQAVDAAATLAGLDEYQRELIEIPLSPQEQFLKEFAAEVNAGQTPAKRWLKQIFNGFGAAIDASIGTSLIGRSQMAGLGYLIAPLKEGFAFVAGMNDPAHVYLHCTPCIAP